jgi:CRP-like cAMP-binding protein
VVTKGAVGACMFVVTEGRIAITVDDKVIERVGPGGAFGEMALIDRSGRSATATAETDSAWLLVGRNEFIAMVKTRPAFGIALMRSMSARVLHIGKLLGS